VDDREEFLASRSRLLSAGWKGVARPCSGDDPAGRRRSLPSLSQQHGPGALNEESSQIAIAAFRYAAENRGFAAWLEATSKRLHPNVLVVALAAKLARIGPTDYSPHSGGRTYQGSSLLRSRNGRCRRGLSI
jgi:hypothetical protein